MKTKQEIIDRYKWIGKEVERLVMNPTDEEKEDPNFIENELDTLGPEARVLEWVMDGDWSTEEPKPFDVDALLKWTEERRVRANASYQEADTDYHLHRNWGRAKMAEEIIVVISMIKNGQNPPDGNSV